MSQTFPQFPNTTFPDVIQTFDKYIDITQDDVERYHAATEAMLAGNLTLAQQLINSIPNVQQKALTSQKMNTLIDTVQALETYFNQENFENIIGNYQNQWEVILNYFEYKGAWNSTVEYKKNNMVSFKAADGATYLYIALKDIPSGQTNPDINFTTNKDNITLLNWYNITIRGQQGETGASGDEVSFYGEWDSNTNYSSNSMVVYNNAWWISVSNNINSQPSKNNSDWQLVIELEGVLVSPVYTTSPAIETQQLNELHFLIS